MVEINNLTTHPLEENFLKKIVQKVLAGEKRGEENLSIVFVGQGRMRKLNKKYRGKNRVTDVLAFNWQEISNKKFPRSQNLPELGEIVICLREVKKNAKRFNSTFEKELFRVLIHGLLHLLGYDHEKNKKEAEKMGKKEEDYLSQILKSEN
jgi:probable rRNA maturation factor